METNKYFIRFSYSWLYNAMPSITMKSEASEIYFLSEKELEDIKSLKSFINYNNNTFHSINDNFTFLFVYEILLINKL